VTYRPTLDEVYLRMLDIFARRSTCVRRQVAAIIVDEDGKVIAIGYNGVPSGFVHCTDVPCDGARDAHGNNRNCMAVHAEQNAFLQAGDRLYGAKTIYCSCTPCFECAKMILNTPIRRVVVNEPYADSRGKAILIEGDVELIEPEDESSEPIRTPDYYKP
jgi:dCMP deaminase